MTSPTILSTDESEEADFDNFDLRDKYIKEDGTILISGIQALVRLPIDQNRADSKAGLNIATMISGYRGSPLGGYDALIQKNSDILERHNVNFISAVNEDLGATIIHGSQIVNTLPNPKYDGVVGIWYGKAPGVDRSGDVFKHANMIGTSKYGGALAIAGDDPYAKSSTLASSSEVALFDAQMPTLYPGNVEEILSLGRYGIELSRYCGLWVGMKIVTDVADAFSTAQVSIIENIKKPNFEYKGQSWSHSQNPTLLPQVALELEKELYEARLKAAVLFARANNLNSIYTSTSNDTVGIIAAGKTYYDVLEALSILGLDEIQLNKLGVRVLKLQMIYPLEPQIIEKFANGLDKIFVIEEKRGFIELLVRDVLFNFPNHPKIVGKTNLNGEILVPANGELVVNDVINVLLKELEAVLPDNISSKFENLYHKSISSLNLSMATEPLIPRTPYFCSGCPHNRSTNVPEGSISGGGIGCHGLTLLMNRNTIGLLHMGGEGVPWVGAEAFSEMDHMYQNMGDGTLFHSGYLAIRQAVASNTNITYKILYNSVVAMTGGQKLDGGMSVPELTRGLEAEGVKEIIICSDDTSKYPRGSKWAKNVKVWDRSKLDDAQLRLRDIKGATVLIYDQPCAADLRRKRKRNLAVTPERQIFINELVCEGCGDCGVKSNCLSVLPVKTEFGRKTQVHQSSCNRDYTCLDGDCPAFVSVISKTKIANSKSIVDDKIFDYKLNEPDTTLEGLANIFLVGIGGTGVVTINQILATAAFLDRKYSTNLDQTGLSQKGGSVISHMRISSTPPKISNRVPKAQADAYIIFDILAGVTESNLAYAHPSRTISVVSKSKVATGLMVKSKDIAFPEENYLLSRLKGHAKKIESLDALKLAENLFGSHIPANMMIIGAAFQAGAIPISQNSIFKAIEMNGVAVSTNKKAFLIGRLTVEDPLNYLQSLEFSRNGEIVLHTPVSYEAQILIDTLNADGELLDIISTRIPELIEYQNLKLARNYSNFLVKVKNSEEQLGGNNYPLTESVARYLFKIMAYKDEYEVARLFLKSEFHQELENNFGDNKKIKYNLHPPLLRTFGWKKKIAFGGWFKFGFKVLNKMRRVRGTAFDIFGYAKIRKMERDIVKQYVEIIETKLSKLSKETIDKTIQIAELPDMIRGYESIKEDNIELYQIKLEKLLE